MPALEVSEVLDFICQELASLTRSRDYSLLWANSKPLADLTVKDAEDVCQRQILADVLARPLVQGTDEQASERAGVGAAMIAGIGAGVFKDYEDARKFAPASMVVTEPNPEPSALYEAHYQRFVDAYPRLKSWF